MGARLLVLSGRLIVLGTSKITAGARAASNDLWP